MPALPGSRHHNSKLTEVQVNEMIHLHKYEKWRPSQLARKYGISRQAAWMIVNGLRRQSLQKQ